MSETGSKSYAQQQYNYWSNQQAETRPVYRVQPRCAKEVAVALLVTKYLNCPFAVKSGGHAAFAGASNIQHGVTIDLKELNQVEVSNDRTLTKVGAGNKWIDVYSKLDPQKLSVVGGRVADIGVGGLTLRGKWQRPGDWRCLLISYRRYIILLRPSLMGLRWCSELRGNSLGALYSWN